MLRSVTTVTTRSPDPPT